jgi:hypothetical protein
MAHTINVDIVDRSVSELNPVNIAVINQPNPVTDASVTGEQLLLLIQIPKYFITDSATGTPIDGTNIYDYFPELNPGGGGGGGGGGDSYTKAQTDTLLAGKVDKQSGYGLSQENYTSAEKTKLANIDEITVDDALNTTSTNPVQNKIITTTITDLEDSFVGMTANDVEEYWTNQTLVVGIVNHTTGELTKFDTLADAKSYIVDNPSVQCELVVGPACTEKINDDRFFNELDNLVVVTLNANVFSDNLQSIGKSAFFGCTNLTTVSLIDDITTIPDGAFASCTALTSFTCPRELRIIGQGTFSNCTAMTYFAFNDKLTTIGSGAFGNVPASNAVTIPGTVSTIPGGAFMNCGFSEVTFGEGVTTISSGAMTGNLTGTTIIRIPSTMSSVGPNAFAGVGSVQEVIINKPQGAFDTSNWGFTNSPTITYTGGNS